MHFIYFLYNIIYTFYLNILSFILWRTLRIIIVCDINIFINILIKMGTCMLNSYEINNSQISDGKTCDIEKMNTNRIYSSFISSSNSTQLPLQYSVIQINLKQGPILKKIINKRKKTNFTYA